MYTINIDNLDLRQIAESGQCFRWKRIEEGHYSLVAFDRFLEMRQQGEQFTFSCDEKEWKDVWHSYFDMDRDYAALGALIESSDDEHLKLSFRNGRGIRILRQDIWEMIVTFLISQNNNIKRITNSVERICEKAGLKGEGICEFYRFPGPFDVDDEFWNDRELGLGYRDTYLREMFSYARQNPEWLDRLKELSYNEAHEELLRRKGIGKKVADCICLFGLNHVEAFPVDTHVKKLLEKYYPAGIDLKRYEGAAGIIQQYLFYEELNHGKNI